MTAAARRELATYAVEQHVASERQACRLVGLSRSAYRYEARRPDDTVSVEQLTALAKRHRRWGFDMMDWLRTQGFRWNHKRVYRVYRELEQVAGERDYPQVIRSDNGPEFLVQALVAWTTDRSLHWDFIEPGKPAQNASIERFNHTYRAKMCWTPICLIRLRKFVRLPITGWKSTTPCDRRQL